MQTRKDQAQAYQFATARMSAAMLMGHTRQPDSPMQRSALGLTLGIVVGVLICVGALVFGLLVPGGNETWKQARTIVVEKESGNRYLYLDGVLRPTVNTASAVLYFGAQGQAPTFQTVSRNSLSGVPHGGSVGIPGAPDSLPVPGHTLSGEWTLCAAPGDTVGPSLGLGAAPGVRPAPGEVFLVRGQDGTVFVVQDDVRYAVRSAAALAALGLGDVAATPVPGLWLDLLADGGALQGPDVPLEGTTVVVDGRTAQIGQVFRLQADRPQNYVLREDGLAPVSPTAAALLTARPGAGPMIGLTAELLSRALISPDRSGLNSVPDIVGRPVHAMRSDTVCVHDGPNDGLTLPKGQLYVAPGLLAPQANARLEPGVGGLVAAMPRPLSAGVRTQQWLVTDQGMRYPVTDDAARTLGGGAALTWLPPSVLDSLPQGPPLVTGPTVLTGGTGKVS